LKPQQQPKVEEMKKVFVGKIPKGVSDEFMERILKVRLFCFFDEK
jgi:hypothetical protein